MNTENRPQENEIDLLLLLRVLLSKAWIIAISAAVLGLGAFIFSAFVLDKQYQSTAQMYIISRQNEGTTTYSDLQTSTQLVKDYKVLVTSRPVLEQVIGNLGLDVSSSQLEQCINVSIATDSRVLTLTVTSNDPYVSKMIVDSLADVSAERICSVMQLDGANIFEYGNIPASPSSPSVSKYTAIGALLGIVLSAAVIIIIYLVDDSIKNSDDVMESLGLSTLALIPMAEEEYNGENSKSKSKKKIKTKRSA